MTFANFETETFTFFLQFDIKSYTKIAPRSIVKLLGDIYIFKSTLSISVRQASWLQRHNRQLKAP